MAYQFASNPVQTVLLDKFGGVDFTSNATQVSPTRSPDMVNMIADSRFFPVKRPGWKVLFDHESGIVHGLHRFVNTDGTAHILAHIGTVLYRWEEEAEMPLTALYESMADAHSTAFTMSGKLYILDGLTYLQYDGETVQPVTEAAFIPTTLIGAKPDGSGTTLEAVNLLQPKRINSFIGDGSAKAFQLDTTDLDETEVTATVAGVTKTETTDFAVNRETGIVTFNTAPVNGAGVDNVVITFAKTVEGYADKINKCRFFGLYGGDNDTKVFVSGNPDEKNVDWYSGTYDPTYFPDTGYTKIGSDASAIVGYIKQYDTQIVLKESNSQDASQFLRTCEFDSDNKIYFPVAQGVAGIGAVSMTASALLEDIPLVLTRQGVYAVVSTSVLNQRMMSCRSDLINQRLLAEDGLENAVLFEYKGKCFVCVNSRCYIADSQQTYKDGTAQYEWYYWENIPAVCFMEQNGYLYFGTPDGKLCRFYKPNETNCYNDNGEPIEAYWTTPYLSFGTWNQYKTVRNVHAVPLPYTRSGIEIYYNTDEDMEILALDENIDLLDFNDLDFNRFTFRTIQAPQPYATGQKERKIILFQVKVRNAEINEPFGFLAIQINYTIGGKVK